MSALPIFNLDEVNRRRKAAEQLQESGPRFIRPLDMPAEKMTEYSGADSATEPQPTFRSSGPGVIPDAEAIPTFNSANLTRPRTVAQPAAMPSFNPSEGAKFQPAGNVSDMERPRFMRPHVTFEDSGKPSGVIGGGSPLDKEQAQLAAWQAYKPQAKHGRFREALTNMGNAYLRGGGLLGALMAFGQGLAKPEINTERSKAQQVGELTGQIKQGLDFQKTQTAASDAALNRNLKVATFNRNVFKDQATLRKQERDAALKDLENLPAIDMKNSTHAAAVARARAAGVVVDPQSWGSGHVQTAYDQVTGAQIERNPLTKTWGPSLDSKGVPITTRSPEKVGKLPDSFYDLEGVNEKSVHAEAIKRAGASAFFSKSELDDSKIKLLQAPGEDIEATKKRVQDSVSAGLMKMSDVVKDSAKSETAQHEAQIATYEAKELPRLNKYRQAVDQTSQEKTSTQMTINQFQSDYKKFWDTYSKAKTPAQKNQIESEYFNYIKGVRLK